MLDFDPDLFGDALWDLPEAYALPLAIARYKLN
jgi:hypothetical protein